MKSRLGLLMNDFESIQDDAKKALIELMDKVEEAISRERTLNNPSSDDLPTVDDDITKGYSPGSFWGYQNTRGFICVSNAEGAADWKELL